MAKINARGARQLAAFSTERAIDRDGETVVYGERFVLRSDGKVLHRIRWTESCMRGSWYEQARSPLAPAGAMRLNHTSGYSIKGSVKDLATFDLRRYLERRGYTITD